MCTLLNLYTLLDAYRFTSVHVTNTWVRLDSRPRPSRDWYHSSLIALTGELEENLISQNLEQFSFLKIKQIHNLHNLSTSWAQSTIIMHDHYCIYPLSTSYNLLSTVHFSLSTGYSEPEAFVDQLRFSVVMTVRRKEAKV